VLSLCVSAASVGWEPRAWAADPATDASAEQRKLQAKSKYEHGVELYRNERYADAVELFLEADALSPSAALSFNIARAYEKLADDASTLRWYRNYLRLNPEAPNAADVRQSIQTLSASLSKKGIQQLTVLSTPSGATVAIDDRPLGVTPLTVELKPVTLRDFTDAERDFTLSAPTPLDLSIELKAAPRAAPPLTTTSASDPAATTNGRRRFGIAPYITAGAGVLALGGAALFEASRRSAQTAARNDKTQIATQDDLNAMNHRQTTARVLLGVGGVLVATGATLFVFNTRLMPESRASVGTLPGGASFTFTRSFW
jgi:tetratricopeptide (TPR) repeat protein